MSDWDVGGDIWVRVSPAGETVCSRAMKRLSEAIYLYSYLYL